MEKLVIEDLISSRKMAVIKDEEIKNIVIESKSNLSYINNIYRGRINKIMKNINSCFIDIGGNTGYMNMGNLKLQEGENILVQVKKDPLENKKMKLSTEVSIKGRYVVYIPSNDRVTVSKKILDNLGKKRLKKDIEEILKLRCIRGGVVARTEALDADINDIEKEILYLSSKYDEIEGEYRSSFSPKLLYSEKDKITTYICDNIKKKICEIHYVDGEYGDFLYDEIKERYPSELIKLKRHGLSDLFENYCIDRYVEKLKSRTVRLKSGGFLAIDRTEAMTVIDVNTGANKKIQEKKSTIFETNYEAAEEIAKQIQLRDISGIIIIDFIDMDIENQNKIKKHIISCFKGDGDRTRVYDFTKLGLLEVSRMRKENSIDQYFKSDSYKEDIIEKYVIRRIEHYGEKEVDITEIIDMLKSKKTNLKISSIEDKYHIKIIL